MQNVKHFLAIASALATAANGVLAGDLPPAFNGRNFDGWKLPENNIWWTVENESIKLNSGPGKKGSTLWTVKEYGDFIMQFDFKMGRGIVDTGIYIRTGREQIQIGISGSLNRDMTASPYIAGKGYPVEAKNIKQILKPKDWNYMTIVAIGKNYSVWLNGQHVMSYDSDSAIERGPLGIQLHGNRDMSAEYRNIAIAELHAR